MTGGPPGAAPAGCRGGAWVSVPSRHGLCRNEGACCVPLPLMDARWKKHFLSFSGVTKESFDFFFTRVQIILCSEALWKQSADPCPRPRAFPGQNPCEVRLSNKKKKSLDSSSEREPLDVSSMDWRLPRFESRPCAHPALTRGMITLS